ncbi:EpsG family protein [Marinobacter sp. DUT-3]|uniref:EpsG family protein n=1 Tax=Marinobacter sp. DUT-3 TaxID=3412036 RepID=UPI003D1857C4
MSLVFILLSVVFQKRNDISVCLAVVYLFILSLIFGLRYGVGIDYYAYENYFYDQHDTFRMEVGYSLVNYYLRELGFHFYSVTLLTCFATNYLALIGGWLYGLRGVYLNLSILLFVSSMMFMSLNGIRQAIAVMLVYAALPLLLKGKSASYLLSACFASLFHVSAVAMTGMVIVRRLLCSYLSVVVLSISFLIVLLFVIFYDLNNALYYLALHAPYYSKYAELIHSAKASGIGLGIILKIVVAFFIVFIFLFHNRKYKVECLLVSLFIIGLAFNVAATTNFLWGRPGMYFYIFEILVLPMVVKNIYDRTLRGLVFLLVSAYALSFIVANLFLNVDALQLRYQSVFGLP